MKKRPWVVASTFVWILAGAVAIAAYSGQPPLQTVAPEHDHASHAGQPHVDEAAALPSSQAVAPQVGSPQTAAIVPKEIQWEENFEAAMQRARTEGKPIMIDFYADWCQPCKMMDARVYPDRNVIAQSQNWITVKVNGEKRPDVMQAYGLRAYPTILFAQGSGQPVSITTGYQDAPQLVQAMQEAFTKWSNAQEKA